jgi:hypothetical protein
LERLQEGSRVVFDLAVRWSMLMVVCFDACTIATMRALCGFIGEAWDCCWDVYPPKSGTFKRIQLSLRHVSKDSDTSPGIAEDGSTTYVLISCSQSPHHGMRRRALLGMAWHSIAWPAWHGLAWHGMASHGTAWPNMAWHGMA